MTGPVHPSRRRVVALLLVALTAVLALAAGPAFATESAPEPTGENSGKVTLPDDPHDKIGLIIIAVSAVFVIGAVANASKQLKGSRPQADGRIRWR